MKQLLIGIIIGVALNIGLTLAAVSLWDVDGNKWRYISKQIQENCAARITENDAIIKYAKIECGLRVRLWQGR